MNKNKQPPHSKKDRNYPLNYDFRDPKILIEWGPNQPPAATYLPPSGFIDNVPLRVPITVRFMWDDGSAAGFHPTGGTCTIDSSNTSIVGDENPIEACLGDGGRVFFYVTPDGDGLIGDSGYEPGNTITYCYKGPPCEVLPEGAEWL